MNDPIERLVRNHLDREAARVDAGAMLNRVRMATPSTLTRRNWLRYAGIGLGGAVAAGLGLHFFLGGNPGIVEPTLVSAEELIREATITHELSPADRCYEIDADWKVTPFQRQFPFRPIARKAKVWTRGDRFFVESAFADGAQWVWGQEASGRVWIAPNRKRVLLYEADELAEPLARFSELMSLRLVSTLKEILEKYEMHRLDSGKPGETILIDAKFRPQPNNPFPRFSRVELEIDPTTKVVLKAVLHREAMGDSLGSIRFTLLETGTQPDERFEYRGHVDANAEKMSGPKPPLTPMPPKFDPRIDPRVRFREEWLRRWQDPKNGK
jgi:hypothetical protein